jgi:rhodanese-related sulfurtransferase
MRNINQEEWIDLISEDDNAVIIDCRTSMEWSDGVFENSLLLNINDPQSFMDDVNKLDKEKNYYVYCRSGVRSVQACQVLESVGIETTYNLTGGILIWDGKIVFPSL